MSNKSILGDFLVSIIVIIPISVCMGILLHPTTATQILSVSVLCYFLTKIYLKVIHAK